ncbi:replication factor-A protein 1 [Gyrodon lividus]|nr:replication factor-A protein 1 [Gyrodon lividus]
MSQQQLSAGICTTLNEASPKEIDELSSGYTVQLLSIKKVSATTVTAPPTDRFRIILSDGIHFVQAMLATQLNELVSNGEIIKNTIVVIDKLTCNFVQDKRLIIILDLHVVSRDEEKIGSPVAAPNLAAVTATVVAPETPDTLTGMAPQPSSSASAGIRQAQARPASSGRSGKAIYPIEGLSPYQNNWTIKARVTQKSEVKTWSNPRGEGKLFNVTLMDETGEIRATGFNAVVDELYDKLEEGKVYYISKARVNLAKRKFSNVQNDYELGFEKNTDVEECVDASNMPMVRYNFIPLSSLEDLQKDSICDVIGIVKEVGPLSEITSKATNRTALKRDLTIVDKSLYSVRMTIWGKLAETFAADDLPVVAFKGVKVGDFGGRSLSTLSSSYMTISPDIEEAHLLRGWYDGIGAEKSFQSHSSALSSGGSSSSGFNRNEMRHLSDVKESQLGMSDKADFFSARATVMHIKSENIAYPACPAQGCNKKVTEVNDGWRCEKCEKTFDRPEYRYIMSMAVADWSGQAWLQGFNDAGLAVFGKTADEVIEIKERNEAEYNALMAQAAGRTFNFSCRAKQDTYNDQSRVRYGISKISPLDYHEEAQYLRDLLMQPTWAQ